MWKIAAVLVLAVLVVAPLAKPQATVAEFDITFKGKMRAPAGGFAFPFTATGTMHWDRTTGEVSFQARSLTASLQGSGALVVTERGNQVWGLTSMEFVDQAGTTGQAIFEGRLSRKGDKFSGKVTALNSLGPDPVTDLTLTKGRVKAVLAE